MQTIADIMEAVFPTETKRRKTGHCPFCAAKVNEEEFRDEASRKEFSLSGLCQNCQDDFFQV